VSGGELERGSIAKDKFGGRYDAKDYDNDKVEETKTSSLVEITAYGQFIVYRQTGILTDLYRHQFRHSHPIPPATAQTPNPHPKNPTPNHSNPLTNYPKTPPPNHPTTSSPSCPLSSSNFTASKGTFRRLLQNCRVWGNYKATWWN
jgi:hypothetical protein